MTSFADYARRYAELGWAVIPVDWKDAYTKAWHLDVYTHVMPVAEVAEGRCLALLTAD